MNTTQKRTVNLFVAFAFLWIGNRNLSAQCMELERIAAMLKDVDRFYLTTFQDNQVKQIELNVSHFLFDKTSILFSVIQTDFSTDLQKETVYRFNLEDIEKIILKKTTPSNLKEPIFTINLVATNQQKRFLKNRKNVNYVPIVLPDRSLAITLTQYFEEALQAYQTQVVIANR